VLIENFRPGVMDKLGLGYKAIRELNPRLVYATVTGYGSEGPWIGKPGQDLLSQSMSGLTWLSGNADDPPTPMGIAVADLTASAHLVQGILACLVRRGITGRGGRVEVSLMESILDLQFEVITTHLNDGGKAPKRSEICNAHAYLGAPYGIYPTADGHLALAMGSPVVLGNLLGCPALTNYQNPQSWFDQRDEIKAILRDHLATRTTAHWLSILEPADIWCADVLSWQRLRETEGYRVLDMEQEIRCPGGTPLQTLRCPIRIDGHILKSPKGAPAIGQHTAAILGEFTQPQNAQA